LILASNSPRRKQLLAIGGGQYQVVACEVDETPRSGEEPSAYVERLAVSKARTAAGMIQAYQPESLVIAADTCVVDANQILGKPADGEEAARMLWQLRGHTHQVYTAIALLRLADSTLLTDVCRTEVPMRAYTQAEIDAYVASGDPLDKAGHMPFKIIPFTRFRLNRVLCQRGGAAALSPVSQLAPDGPGSLNELTCRLPGGIGVCLSGFPTNFGRELIDPLGSAAPAALISAAAQDRYQYTNDPKIFFPFDNPIDLGGLRAYARPADYLNRYYRADAYPGEWL
jgi:MAF protein